MIISDLVKDWGGFEKLVAELHETGDVTVEHNAILVGTSPRPKNRVQNNPPLRIPQQCAYNLDVLRGEITLKIEGARSPKVDWLWPPNRIYDFSAIGRSTQDSSLNRVIVFTITRSVMIRQIWPTARQRV